MVSDYAKAQDQTPPSQTPESEIQPAASLTPESDIKLPESLAQEQAAIFAGRRGIDHPKDIHDPGDDLDVENIETRLAVISHQPRCFSARSFASERMDCSPFT